MHLDLHHKRAQEATVKVDWKVLFYWTGLATVVYNIVVFGKESDPTDTLALMSADVSVDSRLTVNPDALAAL